MELFVNGHVGKQAVQALGECKLDDEQALLLAKHICECKLCADLLAKIAESAPQYDTAPAGITSSVVHRIEQHQNDRKKQFWSYTMRIAACAAVALLMLFSGLLFPGHTATSPDYTTYAPIPETKYVERPDRKQEGIFEVTGQFFSGIAQNLFRTEE